MANRKNTHKSNRRTATATSNTATSNDPLGEEQGPMKQIYGLFRLEEATWAEFGKFVAEQGDAVVKEYGLEEGDLDGGLGIAAWIAYLCIDAERASQPQVDAAIRYLDPSTSA